MRPRGWRRVAGPTLLTAQAWYGARLAEAREEECRYLADLQGVLQETPAWLHGLMKELWNAGRSRFFVSLGCFYDARPLVSLVQFQALATGAL